MSGWQDAPVVDAPAPAGGAPPAAPTAAGRVPIAAPQPIPQGADWSTFHPADYGLPDGAYFDPASGEHSMFVTVGSKGGKGDVGPAAVQQSVRAAVTGAQPAPQPQPAPAPSQPAAAAPQSPGGSWMDAPEVKAESYPGGGGDPGKLTGLQGALRGADTLARQATNAITFGLADKAEAAAPALPALLRGDTQDFLQQYSRNLTGQQVRNKADFREAPVAAITGMVGGALAQGAFLPAPAAANLVGRIKSGAAMGAALGAADSLGNSRGDIRDLPQDLSNIGQALKVGAFSGTAGGVLGGILGKRLPVPETENPQGVASIADHDLVKVDPAAATQGGQMTRQVSQMLAATPMGGPLRKLFSSQQRQTAGAVERLADSYGTAVDAAQAGAPIVAGDVRAVAANEAARDDAARGIGDLAQRYGLTPKRRVAGEDVQAGVSRFARGDGSPARNAGELPARATSFSQKSNRLYDQAFSRLDAEMAGKTGSRPAAGAASLPQKGETNRVTIGGQAVDLSGLGQSAREAVENATQSAQDRALNVIRSGKPVRPNKGPSLLEFISKNGGVRDEGGELSGLDTQLWHREAAFRNKAVRPDGRSLEDMAQLAYDQGYFPEKGVPSWEGADNMQAISGQDLLDAIRQELAGNKRFAEFDPQQAELLGHVNDLQELIDHLGLDPRRMNNRQIKATIDEFMGVRPGSTAAKSARPPGASQIDPAATQAVLQDIFERNQSPAVRDLLLKPEVKRLAEAAQDTTHLSFQDLRDLRTWVREAQDDPKLRQNIGAANLQRLESSLTEDIYANARKLGSLGAEQQLRRADQFYGAGQKRIQGSLQGFFQARSGEAAFDRILSSASNGGGASISRLRALQRSLRPEEWGDIASGVINHMGGPDGFDLGRFVKAFDGLSVEGRDVLFGGRNAPLKRSLDRLVNAGREALQNEPKARFGDTPNAAFEGLRAAANARGRAANVEDIRAVRAALTDAEWGDVAAGVLRTMGRTDTGLSVDRFVTEWEKLSPAARDVLFGGPGREDGAKALDALVRVMKQQKAAGKLYNHSGSGNHIITALLLEKPLEAAFKGEFMEAGTMLGVGAVGYAASHLLANPKFARFAAWAVEFNGPFSVVEQRLNKLASDPAIGPYVADFRQNLRSIRANAPATVGASVTQQREKERVDPRTLPQRQLAR